MTATQPTAPPLPYKGAPLGHIATAYDADGNRLGQETRRQDDSFADILGYMQRMFPCISRLVIRDNNGRQWADETL